MSNWVIAAVAVLLGIAVYVYVGGMVGLVLAVVLILIGVAILARSYSGTSRRR